MPDEKPQRPRDARPVPSKTDQTADQDALDRWHDDGGRMPDVQPERAKPKPRNHLN